MTAQRIEAMLRPASVAIVGASDTPGSNGHVLVRNLLEGGFDRRAADGGAVGVTKTVDRRQ